MAVLCALGFSSGLPYLLTSLTLQAWLTTRGLTLKEIAAFAPIGLAYTLKVLWAPLLDRFRLPMLGRRRGWMLVLQLALGVAIAAMGTVDPVASPAWLAVLACAVALLSASQDVVLDAYSTDVLAPEERAAGTGVYVFGYRVALLVTGTLALVLADHVAWRVVYAVMAAFMVIGVIATLAAEEPAEAGPAPRSVAGALVAAVRELLGRRGARGTALLLAFAASYELGYFFAQAAIMNFLQTGPRFTLTEIATVNKALGFAGTALGAVAGGALVARFGLRRMLLAFGALAAATHLLYAALALAGHDLPVFCGAVLCDSVANAMVTTAFLAVLMGACSAAVSATQFALLTSLSSVGKNVFGPLTAVVVAAVGWPGFFVVTAGLGLPGLALAWWIAA